MPKLIGSYEQQIYPWLENLHKKYKQIYNIGCAEGYYAVGLAKKYPGIHIHACDISPVALDLCRELANLNSVTNISFHSRFVLPRKINSRLLIICDIEGDEYQLLDPYKHPYFKQCDLIVECHDFIKPNSSVLINRFRKTHQILLATDTHKVQSDYPYLKTFSPRIFQLMTDEGRPENGLFWVMLQMER
jgi:SAM-dependent methyltransferase